MILRELSNTDLEEILAIRNHDEIRKYMFNTQLISLEQHKEWFQRYLQDNSKITLLGVDEQANIIGVLNINFLTSDRKIVDWGFYVKPNSPKGSGTKLLILGLEKIFNEYQSRKVFGQSIGFNDKSIQIHKKLGFKQEGILREHYHRDGKFYDIYEFGLLNTEYQRLAL
ncbi:UDP-4-amino-4,6-dideoxy-N-acetyl-beta-L-altrosamine N-acetyltransferase [Rodentibacter trehalosifermentans]|uniref:UDP-4-amino-4, 6-dideoxy-N-acetyl-beta-L-altrosamine N-acetyltransferase n=1 Tax=Rodentibacter trehalosifermentans TaxID=1908263 RepID=A0A1V3ITY2_9PAST|nr:UDP-4-amino-4,6-dideoxy-N-acetyl-beta-L-altrosamine N-acetyltransferase [Rodentibacter trehalosifermentans]OOF45500.1 UDP-4-amino-4,6-dideoxy-N-acetyl-beta-L-altrosamine N-acetyltransferase [Rodentibacter trehalosifermentans]